MKHLYIPLFLTTFLSVSLNAQMITGVWKGKINRQKVEIKIIQDGDSLRGTSYYYESPSNYRRYALKGYFDANTNEAVWWDDHLIEEKTGNRQGPGKIPLMARADFNCPGDGRMMLDGKSGRLNEENPANDLHLDKSDATPSFPDEWDYVIDNFSIGANDPYIIDSINSIAGQPQAVPEKDAVPAIVSRPARPRQDIPATTSVTPAPKLTIEEKFTARKKVLVTEIPLTGDSIELRFYDNAEIDGDSISLFLNEKLLFQHIRLLGTAYTIHLATSDLKETNELIMVAENLGSIPPNTSFMVAIVGDKRYEARLESTEGSSAMILLKKPQ